MKPFQCLILPNGSRLLEHDGPLIRFRIECDASGKIISADIEPRVLPPGAAPTPGAGAGQGRPAPTVKEVGTFAQAMLTARRVPLEVARERVAICATCQYRRTDPAPAPGKSDWCGVCGCPIMRESAILKGLAEVEESLPRWGCKHPQRAAGKGWTR